MTQPLTANDIRAIRQQTLASLTTGSKAEVYNALQAAIAAHKNGSAAKKPCHKAGCKDLTSSGRFCTAHDVPANRYGYDQRRGSPKERGYDADWRRIRVQALQRDCFLCQQCLREDRLKSAEHVDHILTITTRPDLRLDLSNLQALCKECHSRKTAVEDGAFGRS